MKVIEHLIKAIREAAVFNPDVQVAPACILWPDHDHQWEAIVPRLQNELPELFILDEYDPESQKGPAIWLRCVIAGKIEDVLLPEDKTPIFYLPGVSRQDLRAVENCPDHLKPLAELQYRGVIWSQINAKDWTILAFLKSDQGGLGLDVAQDNSAKNAMQLALYRLLDEEIDLLKGKRLDKDYFNTLLTGGDPVRDLLHWLDQGDGFRAGRGENEWRAFVEVCKSQLAFDPENDGILAGAEKLATHQGPWHPVWERFCEAPARYSNIPLQIGKCTMPPLTFFSNSDTHGSWPQWNEMQEDDLRKEFSDLFDLPPHEARKQIAGLDKKHDDRRDLVWAELGESQLAMALKHLAVLSEITINALAAGTAEELAAGYCNYGWKADNAVLSALNCVDKQDNFQAVTAAIRSVYLPWAEESARHFQKVVENSGYPGGTLSDQKPTAKGSGECILFVDGLRFDVARLLSKLLSQKNYQVEEKKVWSALPSVTATCKPAVSPVRKLIRGDQANVDFEPSIAESGQSLKGGYHLKKLLNDNGWHVLDKSEFGDGNGCVWCEFGDIDHEGHDRGWKLSRYLDSILSEICDRVEQLISSGWETVHIVTDHGWLLMPGGLPKIELPSALVENKWGRCAVVKTGAVTEERLYPWYWNPDQNFALADGISCFRKGEEYAHGGLSLQECLTLELSISKGSNDKIHISVKITDVVWKGLRCNVAVDGDFTGLSLDIREQAGNPSTSAVMGVKPIKENGISSVVIEDDELEGAEMVIVLINEDGSLMAQRKTVIGGGNE